jgi:hypothetical protein
LLFQLRLTGIFLLFTSIVSGQDTTSIAPFPKTGYKEWTKYQTCGRLGIGIQQSGYIEAGISRLKYIYNDLGYASSAYYGAIEWTPDFLPEKPRHTYGFKLGYEINLRALALGLEAKYQSDNNNNNYVITPKIGIGVMGIVNLFYGYNIYLKDNFISYTGPHQFSLTANLSRRILQSTKSNKAPLPDSLKKSKIWISISGGASLPLPNFSNYINEDNNLEGGADIGLNGRIEGKYLLRKNFGFLLSIFSTRNKNIDVQEKILFPPPSHPGHGGGTGYTSYKYEAGDWQLTGLTGGIVMDFITNSFLFNFNISGGIEQVRTPEVRIERRGYYWQLSQPTADFSSVRTQEKSTSYCFVFDAGYKLGIVLRKKLQVYYMVGYQASNPLIKLTSKSVTDYEDYPYFSTQKHYESSYTSSFNKPLGIFYLNLGVGYLIKD